MLRIALFDERVDLRLRHLLCRARLIELLLRDHTFLRHPLGAVERDLRVLELRFRGHLLRLGGGEIRFGLADLIVGLPLLEAQRRGAFRDLRAGARGAGAVERLLLLQLARVEHRDHLIGLDLIAFVHVELVDAAGNLRADDDVVGRDNAGEDERHR